jgi:hypothetical protein
MKRSLSSLVLAIALTIPTAVGAQDAQMTPPQRGMPMMSSMMQSCPMNVRGATVTTADTKSGISITITTENGDVTDLRHKTESMAKMHSDSSKARMPGGSMAGFTAKYKEIPKGAQLTLTPKDAKNLDEFRRLARQHVEQMKKGECSMMQGMMQGTATNQSEPKVAPKAEPKPEEDHNAHHPEEGKK